MFPFRLPAAALSAAVAGLLLVGCATGTTGFPDVTGTSPKIPGAFGGQVFGGRQPIVGAHVFLFAAGTAANAGPGIAASTSNASTSLLTNYTTGSYPTTLDTDSSSPTYGDYYVTTDASGGFGLTGEYTPCTQGTQVYIYAVGGMPNTNTTNSAASNMAVLGTCPAGGDMSTVTPAVYMNEISTVAAAYALAGFASDALHVSSDVGALSGAAQTQVNAGITNAFATAGQLYAIGSASNSGGGATALSGNGSNSTVPQAKLNTLANILAACVNSEDGSECTTLFATATSTGASGGTQPTETASAAINIAHNPAASSAFVTALWNLASDVAPYPNPLSTAPTDWGIAITFTGGGMSHPNGLAIDATGDVWVANGGGNLSEFGPLGVPVSASGYSGSEGAAYGVALDASGNPWVSNEYAWTEFSSSGSVLATSSAAYSAEYSYGLGGPIAFDASGDLLLGGTADAMSNSYIYALLVTVTSGGTASYCLSSIPSTAVYSENQMAIVGSSVWIANSYGSPVAFPTGCSGSSNTIEFQSVDFGIAVAPNGEVWTAGGQVVNLGGSALASACGDTLGLVSVDGSGRSWWTDESKSRVCGFGVSNGNPVEITAPGIAISGLGRADAVDGSGNLWIGNYSGSSLIEVVGAATPVAVPLVYQTIHNLVGARL